jgi:hypothetical protein
MISSFTHLIDGILKLRSARYVTVKRVTNISVSVSEMTQLDHNAGHALVDVRTFSANVICCQYRCRNCHCRHCHALFIAAINAVGYDFLTPASVREYRKLYETKLRSWRETVCE